MTSRFVALPVGKGDSFYLERDTKTVLFDGGQALNSLPSLIKKYTQCNGLDVVVCSHNDADHANGLIGLLDDTSILISEVWLPGRWASVVHRIANENDTFSKELYFDSLKQSEQSLEDLLECPYDSESAEDLESNTFNSETLANDLEKLERPTFLLRSQSYFTSYVQFYLLNNLFLEALEAADRIVKIATKAWQRGCRIRWFDFKEFKDHKKKAQGGEVWLRPLNSVEIKQFKKTTLGPLKLLALTVANRESLTFCSAIDKAPSVVFSADSNLRGVLFPTLHSPIITAPHHGAESNKEVYGIPNLNVPYAVWVRSDMNSSKRPCSEFMNTKAQKYCTRCRNKTGFEQHIELIGQNNWCATPSIASCSC